ncbi:MAG TPA: threonine synthase [Firmicutes bacterium]|nr:threonine synthase [Bacillota bacterium]
MPIESSDEGGRMPALDSVIRDSKPCDFLSRDEEGIWRHKGILPDVSYRVSLGEGMTPLVPARRLPARMQLAATAYLKMESANPTGSFKDRASAVGVSAAVSSGFRRGIIASTGNAAASFAAYATRAAMESYVLVPRGTVQAKMTKTLIHGPRVFELEGDISDCIRMAAECANHGFFNATTIAVMNPLCIEGYKTISYEIFEELGEMPAWVAIPLGAGPLAAGICKGFDEVAALTGRPAPRVVGVQAAGCAPIFRAYISGGKVAPWKEAITTRVAAIADPLVGYVEDGQSALEWIRKLDGIVIAVEDDEIFEAQRELASAEGIFAEPAACASIVGLKELARKGLVREKDTVVAVVTGHGLNDPASVAGLPAPERVEARLEALLALVDGPAP